MFCIALLLGVKSVRSDSGEIERKIIMANLVCFTGAHKSPCGKSLLLLSSLLVLNISVSLGVDIFDTSYPYFVTERESALTFANNFCKLGIDPPESNGNGLPEKPSLELSLADTSLKTDMTALVAGCECYTCRKHTRAYIHHLLAVR